MEKIKRLTILLSSFSIFANAQITFQKTFGSTGYESAYACCQTDDGGYIASGISFTLGAGYADIYLIKTDSNGDLSCTKTYGGSDNDEIESMQPTSDGGFILAGFTQSYGAGSRDVLLVKIDSVGNLLWSKTYGGSGYEYASDVGQTSDGGYILVGYTTSLGPSNGNVYLIKTDANGDSLWIKTFASNNSYEFHSVEQTTDGGYVLAGSVNSFLASSNDFCIIKCDAAGNVTWMKRIGGPDNENAFYAIQTNDGGFIISGGTISFGVGMSDALLVKIDSIGTVTWAKTYGGVNNESIQFIQQTNDQGYILTGLTNASASTSDVLLIKTDSVGNLMWTKSYGGPDIEYGDCVKQTNDNGYIIAGSFGFNLPDMCLIKTDANGNSGCNDSSLVFGITQTSLYDTSFIPTTYYGGMISSPVMVSGTGGSETTICTSVGMNEDLQKHAFKVFPNPFTDEIKISWQNNTEQVILTIQNTLGETVFSAKENENSGNNMKIIDLRFLSEGVYFIEMIIDGELTVRKIVKE